MARRFINQLGENESVDEVFLVWDKQLRTNRNGNLYLQLRLADRTGSLTGMMWNANDRLFNSFDNGDYIQVQGATQYYSGALQMIVNQLEKAVPGKFDESDFVTLGTTEIDRLASTLSRLLRELTDVHLRNLAECFLMDESFMEKFTAAPAGIKNHHAYRGGLLEHVVNLMEVASAVAEHYPDVNRELLLMGTFLHDIGKIDELAYDREMTYTDAGQLLGHIVLAIGILEKKIEQAADLSGDAFPQELALKLKHMILSHHGEYEYGSPKLPMTLEAIMLHFLDNLDSKIHNVAALFRDDPNVDGRWTAYQPNMSRKFFRGDQSDD